MIKNIIDFFIALRFLLPQFLGLAVGLLQLLQYELYITNTEKNEIKHLQYRWLSHDNNLFKNDTC